MAELGAIAAVVQLVDVALRVSGEIRSFLDAYKDTRSDVKALRDALRDVEANVRNLVKYTAEFKKSKNAVEEFEVLSETIISSLKGYDEDVLAAKRLLPSKPTEKIKEKVHWVLHKQKAGDLTRRLNERSGRLNTALGIVGRIHDLRVRQDTSQIIQEQAASRTAASKRLGVLQQSIQKQENDHAELLTQSRTISSQINAVQASSTHEHESIASGISRQSMLLNRKLSTIDNKSSMIVRKMQKAETALGDIQSQTQRMRSQYTKSINCLAADVHEIHTQTTCIASSVDMAAKILREELRTTLKPIVEQAFTTSNSCNEARIQRMEDLIQQVAHDMGDYTHAQRSKAKPNVTSQQLGLSHISCDYRSDHSTHQSGKTLDSKSMTKFGRHTESGLYNMVSTYKRRWFRKWKIGSLEVETIQITRRTDGSPQSNSTISIQIHFRPRQSFLSIPGISIFYSTAPNSQGYCQLAPMVATVPILDGSHPVWDVLEDGDVGELQDMLATGAAHLRCQDEEGWTLLHYAAYHGHLETCEFLTSQGLSWHQTAVHCSPMTPAHALLGNTITPRSSAPLEALRFLESIGNNTENILLELAAKYYFEFSNTCYPENVSDFCRTIRYEYLDTWTNFFPYLARYCYRTDLRLETLLLFEMLLAEGLDPNAHMLRSWGSRTLLQRALRQIREEKKRKSSQTQPCIEESGFDSASSQDITVQPWCMVKALIKSGVDIYYMNPEDFDKAIAWDDIRTPSVVASTFEVHNEWRTALAECELDPNKVYLEDERRRKQAMRLRGASRSGVDVEMLELPPIDGFRSRICRRSWCKKHTRWYL